MLRTASSMSIGSPSAGGARPLKLVGQARKAAPQAIAPPANQRIEDVRDPRWVLAVRTASCLQGSVLSPEKREHLLRVGRSMRLSAFDANLVIAVIQDQARRGQLAHYCPQAAAAQLAMIPKPRRTTWTHLFHGRSRLPTAIMILTLLALQAWLIAWLLG